MFAHRLRDNMRRDTTQRKQASARSAASSHLTELEMEISDIQAKQREGQSRIKELREKTKALEADGARKNTKPSKYNDFNAANSVQQL